MAQDSKPRTPAVFHMVLEWPDVGPDLETICGQRASEVPKVPLEADPCPACSAGIDRLRAERGAR